MLSEFYSNLLIGLSFHAIHVSGRGKGAAFTEKTQGEDSLSNAAEVTQLQAVPEIHVRLVTQLHLIFLKQLDPEV